MEQAIYDANKFEWLDAIQPKEAFVSHTYHRQFGHPKCEAIRNLISIGSVLTNTKLFTSTHPFMCGDRLKNKNYVRYDGEICHHIFSTYPGVYLGGEGRHSPPLSYSRPPLNFQIHPPPCGCPAATNSLAPPLFDIL